MGWQDNHAWDDAVERDPRIVLAGKLTDDQPPRPSTRSLHRPHEVLVVLRELDRPVVGEAIRRRLGDVDASPAGDDDDRRRIALSLGLELFHVPSLDVDLPSLVRELREIAPGAAAVNSVMVAGPQRHGGDSPPTPAPAPTHLPGEGSGGARRTIAVLDTGIIERAPFRTDHDPVEDVEAVPLPPDALGPAAGHGTFVAGIINRHAPGATLLVRRVLQGPDGVADELDVAKALDALPPRVDIVNMSFGGFAVDDARMLALEAAVNAMPRRTLLVAAAGNHGVATPFFPAAFKRVLAVGAAELPGEPSEPAEEQPNGDWHLASYSNFGSWVDGCSLGTDVWSAFVHYPAPTPPQAFAGGAEWSGTSFAAPRVSAAVAVLAQSRRVDVRSAAHRLLFTGSQPDVAGVGRLVL